MERSSLELRASGGNRHETFEQEDKAAQMKDDRHILKQDRRYDCNTAMTWTPEEKRKKGRPKYKTIWRRAVEKERERKEAGWLAFTERGKSHCKEVEAFYGSLMRHEACRR